MTVSAMLGRQADTSTDWFDGLDARLPVALLRFVAASAPSDVGSTVSAVMEIAFRRTASTGPADAAPGTTARSRRNARRAVIEPRALPADIGRRFVTELAEVAVDELLPGGERIDSTQAATVLSELLAVRLGVPVPVSRAALAVALSVEDPDTRPRAAVRGLPQQRGPEPVRPLRVGLPGDGGVALPSPAPATA